MEEKNEDRGLTGSKPGQIRFQGFWAHTLAGIVKKSIQDIRFRYEIENLRAVSI